MANRKRDVQILLWVTPEEKKMIRNRMILSKTSNMSVYLRKMAIDGMIVNTDIIIDPQLSIEKPYADLCFYYPYGLSGTLYSSSGELASSLSCHCTQAATT